MAKPAGMTAEPLDLSITVFDSAKKSDPQTGKPAVHGVAMTLHPDAPVPRELQAYAVQALNPSDIRAGKHGTLAMEPMSAERVEAIKAAAGTNSYPMLDKSGNQIGTTYGVKAQLAEVRRAPRAHAGVGPRSMNPTRTHVLDRRKSLEPSSLSVAPDAQGRDINTRYAQQAAVLSNELRAARKAAYAKETASLGRRVPGQEQSHDGAQMGG